MAASEDGSTIVVYGGRIPLNTTATPPITYTGTFYTLDVPSGKWTQGPDGDIRLYMACLIVGDQFIAWGGTDGNNTYNTPPRVFDLTKYQWVTSYTAPLYYLNAPKSTSAISPISTSTSIPSPNSSDSSKTSSNLGAILGGTFGGLFVITLAALIFVYLKRKEDSIKYGYPAEQQQQRSAGVTPHSGVMGLNSVEKETRGRGNRDHGHVAFQ